MTHTHSTSSGPSAFEAHLQRFIELQAQRVKATDAERKEIDAALKEVLYNLTEADHAAFRDFMEHGVRRAFAILQANAFLLAKIEGIKSSIFCIDMADRQSPQEKEALPKLRAERARLQELREAILGPTN